MQLLLVRLATGLEESTWRGFRYTPDEAGPATMGVVIRILTGERLEPELPPMSWEFWEQQ